MVIDDIKNARQYFSLSKGIEKGLRYLLDSDFSKMAPGRYEIDKDNVYALIQDYTTRKFSESKIEAHKKYIDIQYIVSGTEQIGYAHIDTLKIKKEYDPQADGLLLDGKCVMLECARGTFCIFFPQDAHMPCMMHERQEKVKKAVVKVKCE